MLVSTSKNCPHCGDNHKGKPFATYTDGYHCFSCGAHKRGTRNFNLVYNKANYVTISTTIITNINQFNLNILKWLRKYHVTDNLIKKYNIAMEKDGSIIMPVVLDSKIVMYQQRWFNPRRIMTYGPKTPLHIQNNKNSIVIVEDFISAIRVGEITDSWCMFGTNIPQILLRFIVNNYDIIIIWADGDDAGISAAEKLKERCHYLINNNIKTRSFANPFIKSVFNVCTKRDPKCYTDSQIHQILKEYL